jgi:hypothetical protein
MRWERILLILGFIGLFIHISRRAIISYTGVDVTFGFSVVGFFFLVLAVLRYRKVYPLPPAGTAFTLLLGLYGVLIILLSVYGWLRGNLGTYILQDGSIYFAVALCIVAGRYDQFWRDLRVPALWLFWIGFFLVCVNLRRSTVVIGLEGTSEGDIVKETDVRAEVQSLGYDLQTYLSLWPLSFALAYQSRSKGLGRFLGLATAPAYLAVSIIFLKRAPVARAAAYMLAMIVASAVLQGRLRMRTAVLTIIGVLMGCLVVGSYYLVNLKARYETGEQTARIEEAQALLGDIRGLEWFVGKGMGGWFEAPPGWEAGLTYVTATGEKGRNNVHIGLLMPLLKGGLLLMALYYVFFFRLFWFKPRRWNLLDINFSARTVLAVYFVFLLIEGPPSLTDPFAAVLVGICCGRAAARAAEEQETLPLEHYYVEQDAYSVDGVPSAAHYGTHGSW